MALPVMRVIHSRTVQAITAKMKPALVIQIARYFGRAGMAGAWATKAQ
jgi:hypothetical protein